MFEYDQDDPMARVLKRPGSTLPGEKPIAHSALLDYYRMGAGRSLAKLWQRYVDESAERPPVAHLRTLQNWSVRYSWQARVARQDELDNEAATAAYRARVMTREEVLARLSDMARGDLGEFDKLDPANLKDHPSSHLIKKIKVTSRREPGGEGEIINTEIELHDPQSALDKMGRHHQLFTDKIDVTTGGAPFSLDDLNRAQRELDEWEDGLDDSAPDPDDED